MEPGDAVWRMKWDLNFQLGRQQYGMITDVVDHCIYSVF